MKIISFSLWGSDPKYTIGAIKNAQLAKQIYPNWVCRFWCGKYVPSSILSILDNMDNVETIANCGEDDWRGLFWRFSTQITDEVVIFRDTDSRLNTREAVAVQDWLESDKSYHIMRDHPWHKAKILGGMWGVKNSVKNHGFLKRELTTFMSYDAYGSDYDFLENRIYHHIKNDSLIHSEFGFKEESSTMFPTERIGNEFVGKVYDSSDETVAEHEKVLEKALLNRNEIF